jgi:hypothetical protein
MFFLNNLWIAPFGVVIWAAGIWQPVWMLREWFRARSPFPEWQPLKWLVAGSIVLVYVSYWFVLEPPQAHSFYVLSPIAMLFAAYCWTFVDSPRWRRVAATLLGANIVFHLGQALIHAPEESLYRNREVVVAAIQQKEPEVLAHRRAFAMRGGPASLDDPTRPHDRLNVHFSDEQVRLGPRRVALWTLTVRNTNPRVAFRDIRYLTSYRDGSGKVLDDKTEIIKGIFQPGEVRTVEINDGLVSAPFTSATIEVLTAEALLPIVR